MYFKLLTYSPREYAVPLALSKKHVAQNTCPAQHIGGSVSNHSAERDETTGDDTIGGRRNGNAMQR